MQDTQVLQVSYCRTCFTTWDLNINKLLNSRITTRRNMLKRNMGHFETLCRLNTCAKGELQFYNWSKYLEKKYLNNFQVIHWKEQLVARYLSIVSVRAIDFLKRNYRTLIKLDYDNLSHVGLSTVSR